MAVALDSLPFSTAWQAATKKRRGLGLNVLALLMTLVLARLVLSMDMGAVFVVALVVVFLAILVQLRYGLYVLFAVCLFFEMGNGEENPFQYPGFFLTASPQTTLRLSGVILTPIELFLLLVVLAWLARTAMSRSVRSLRAGDLGWPALLLSMGLAWGIVRGLMANANVNFTLWESRFLIAMVICYIVAANLIRTRAHVQALLALIMIVVGMT